jgi:hypothetical protein
MTPYRTAPAPLVYVAPLPRLNTSQCYGCGDGTCLGTYQITVRPCSWWRRLLGCRERREHVHVQHWGCGVRWVTQPAGHR